MSKNDFIKNGSMPATAQSGTNEYCSEDMGGSGITKREYFAALAMNSTILFQSDNHDNDGSDVIIAAEQAVRMADALLKELEK